MEDESFLTVVGIKIVGEYMFAQYKTISESLNSYIPQNLVIVLVPGSMQADGMAGIRLERFPQFGVSDLLVQTELGIFDDKSGNIFQEGCGSAWIHFASIEMYPDFQILHRKDTP